MFRKFSFYVSFVLVLCMFGSAWGLEWVGKDIGNPGIPGSSSYDPVWDIWTVLGTGHDVWDTGDGGYYLYQPMSGNGSLTVNLLSMDITSGWAKVGPAIRETATSGSKHAMTAMTGSNGVQFVWRETTGGGSGGIAVAGEVPPKYLRITRSGNLFTAEYGHQSNPWSPVVWDWANSHTVPMGMDVTVGMFVCATNQGALNTAVMANVVLDAAPYPKPWDLSPVEGAAGQSLTPTLDWRAGEGATSHEVWMGTDPMALALMDTVTDSTYTVGTPLAENTTYYWQIVEQPGGAPGPVLSFTTIYVAPWYMGSLNWEQWTGMPWEEVIRMVDGRNYLLNPPNFVDEMPDAKSPLIGTDTPVVDYGLRMSGHLVPGMSGDYRFWIAGDDGTLLRLNTDTDCADLTRIAWHYRFSGNFDANPEQMSDPIYLEAGQKYAIEILLKEAGGGDWVEVAWEGPDAPSRTRITGDYLTNAYAVNARPDTGKSITPLERTTLSWTAGKYATSQEVLFGTDPGAMLSIDTLPADPTVIVERSETAMPEVAAGNTYYWQVISTDGTETWAGDVWCFTVSDWVGKNIGIDPINEDAPEPPLGYSTYDPMTDITTIGAGGHELWGDNDEFHFRYTTMQMTRDTGMIQARVLSISPADSWRRAGVMIREDLSVASPRVIMLKTGHNNAKLQWRDYWRAGTGNAGPGGTANPTWVRLKREGNYFEGYYSQVAAPSDDDWIFAGSRTVSMALGQPVYIGLAGCHHPSQDQSILTTSVFDNLTITTPDPREAYDLDPENGATMVDIHATLRWAAGEGATEHQVYFSADEEAVVTRDLAVQTILPAETTELAVGPLVLGTVYYWCVDEVVNPIVPGEVVSFTAEDYRTIDDFESYDVAPEDLPGQVFIPGIVLIASEEPPPQEIVEAAYTISAEEPPAQIEIDPGVIVEPGYTIPGYTIPGYTVPAIAPPDCLLAEWTFEGNYDDTSGSGFHGTPVGNATIVPDATRGGDVLSLDGDGDFVDCNNPPALNFEQGDWALSAWTKNTMTGGGDENKGTIIANGQDATPGHRYCLIISEQSEGKVNLVIDDNGTGDTIGSQYNKKQFTADTAINDDVWHHTLGVRDGTKLLIYTDGVLENSIDIPADYDLIGTAQDNVRIGAIGKASDDSIYKYFAGLIDDARIYNCALTEENARFLAEVGDLVVDPIEVPPVEVPPVVEGAIYEPLLVHYEFEGSALDSSGNQHHGTVVPDGSWPKYGNSQSAGLGQAIEFNDDGDHVVDDDSEDYMNGLDALTISCWIKSEKTDRDEGWVHFGTDWSDRRSFRYDKDGGSSSTLQHVIKYGVATTTGNEEEESSDWVQTKEWQHVAMTWQSGQGMKLYIDGVLNQPGWLDNDEGGVLQGYSQLLVGKGSKDDGGGESWNGFIDDLRIYNTPLSYGQVRYLAGKMDDLVVPPAYGPLIAGYDFELGDATDSSGNNFHGTLLGSASVVDGELILSGGDKCVDLGSDNRFNPGAGPFSISAWFKMNGWGQSWGNVIVGNRGENGRGWQLRRRGGDQRLVFTTRGCGNDDPGGNIDPALGEWHHVAAVRDGASKRLYIDNVLDNNAGINTNPITMAGHNVYIGARAVRNDDSPERYFDGDIDDVKLYDLALTIEEIRYLAGLEDLMSPDAYVPLRLHYEFEGDALDSTDNANHGTEQGDPVYAGGALGQAIDLDGDGDYISTGKYASELGIGGNSPRTLSAWVLTRSFCNGGIYDVGNRSTDQDFSLRTLDCTDNRWRVQYWGGDYDFTYDSKDKWVHFTHLHDGAYTQIYADGVLIVNWARTINTTDNNPFQVGMYGWTGDAFNGLIDDMRVYDIALNLGQIRTLAGYVSPDFLSNTWSGRAAAAPALQYMGGAHEGTQCMRVKYTGSGAVSRLEPFGDGKHPHGWNGDFSLGQAQALSLWFRGIPTNNPGAMFAQLTTVVPSGHTQRVMYDGDPEDLQNPNWQEWTMSLKALSTGKPADPIEEMGLPVTKIKDVGVGIIGGGGGTLYFDDLRLYPTRCVPKYGPAYDLTDDCGVDREDMGVIANAWLAEEGANGLWYEYYEGNWNPAPYFPGLPLVTQGTVDNFDIGVRLQNDYFGFRFTGIVAAPVGGDYTFYTESDDGSLLYIDGFEVVNNDWNHGMQWREGTINLTAGEHTIEVIMYEIGGGEGLNVDVAGPGIPRMRIPNEVLFLAPGIPADLNGDGIVNFLDYADVLNHFGEELLFPSPGEEL